MLFLLPVRSKQENQNLSGRQKLVLKEIRTHDTLVTRSSVVYIRDLLIPYFEFLDEFTSDSFR